MCSSITRYTAYKEQGEKDLKLMKTPHIGDLCCILDNIYFVG